MADSGWSQDRSDEVPPAAEENRKVPEPEGGAEDAPDDQDDEEPGPDVKSWQFWAQLAVEKGLPLAIQLLEIWNLAHGNGG
jgi:hypothetical protein